MRLGCRIFIAIAYACVSNVCALAAFVNSPSALNANDSVSWSQLGAPGDPIQAFHATSGSGIDVLGTFNAASGGAVGEVCPAVNCNYSAAPGFGSGDYLVWTEDQNGNGTGPLSFIFDTPVRGAGLFVQLTAPGLFIATLTEVGGGTPMIEPVASDANGDPVFLGALDPAADITAIGVGILSCIPASPGGCDVRDFAVDKLQLATTVPEPASWVPALLGMGMLCAYRKRIRLLATLCGAAWAITALPTWAQDPIPFEPGKSELRDGTRAVRKLMTARKQLVAPEAAAATSVGLPLWTYRITSPMNGITYGGYMVGANPFNRGARAVTIPTILVPVIFEFQNTTTGFTATFDPTGTPDAGCTAGETVMSLVEESPIFQNNDWILNGVYAGKTQYIDAYQRVNFWQYVQNTGDAYHTTLAYTEGVPLKIVVTYTAPTPAAQVRVGLSGPCTNPAGSGTTNAAGYQGEVDILTVVDALNKYMLTQGTTPNQFVIFVPYNVVMTENDQPGFFYGGYHFSNGSPGQTYAIAEFQTNQSGKDVAILSHEIGEWMNDPGGANGAPAWGHIGQVSGCQRNLEVGDPLTGTVLPVVGSNGFTYHVQELTFFSWFFRTPSIGAGGLFSDNGTFTADAGAVCQ